MKLLTHLVSNAILTSLPAGRGFTTATSICILSVHGGRRPTAHSKPVEDTVPLNSGYGKSCLQEKFYCVSPSRVAMFRDVHEFGKCSFCFWG